MKTAGDATATAFVLLVQQCLVSVAYELFDRQVTAFLDKLND